MYKNIITLLLLLSPTMGFAASPVCHEYVTGNYCQYTGKVKNIYINSGNLILIYFDNSVDVAHANSLGFNISNGNASAFLVTENPEFAKLFYSTALAAQASRRNITIQMRGNQSGYLKFDRIWLADQ